MAKRKPKGPQKLGGLPKFNQNGQLRDSKGRFLSKEATKILIERTDQGRKDVKEEMRRMSGYTESRRSYTPSGLFRNPDGTFMSKADSQLMQAIIDRRIRTGEPIEMDLILREKFERKELGDDVYTELISDDYVHVNSIEAEIEDFPPGYWYEVIDLEGNVYRSQDKEYISSRISDIRDEIQEFFNAEMKRQKEQGKRAVKLSPLWLVRQVVATYPTGVKVTYDFYNTLPKTE